MPKDHIVDYTVVAASNTDVDGVDTGEGTAPSNVNDAMREIMADISEFYQDVGGGNVSGGAGGAYTLTTKDGLAAYAQKQIYAFEANHAMPDTATASLNINAIGAKPLRKNTAVPAAGSIDTNHIVMVAYEGTNDEFQMVGGDLDGASAFEKGTKAPFYQDAAPLFWTIDPAVDEHAVRLTKGSVAGGQAGGATGGTHNFSVVFAALAEKASPGVASHVITEGELAAHTHGPGSYQYARVSRQMSSGGGSFDISGAANTSVGGVSGSTGSNTGHGHTFDNRVKWASMIVATKD